MQRETLYDMLLIQRKDVKLMNKRKNTTEILLELRTTKGLNQTSIAKMLGIRQQTYSNYEKGICELPTRHLLKLSQYYNVHTDYILGNTASWDNKYELNAPFTPDYTIGEFLSICMSLNEHDRKSIYDMATFLNKK